MTTGRDVFEKSISIIDELSDNGMVIDSQVKEYKSRAPYLLDLWQKEMVKSGDCYKTFELACTRKENLLGDLNNYGIIRECNGETDEYTAFGAHCFYIETDGNCVVSFTEDGIPLSGRYIFNGGPETEFTGTINITVPEGTTSFLPIRGILDSAGEKVTMAISGTYYFRHNNRALCPYRYDSASKVPDFKPWIRVKMPDDFKSRAQIISETKNWQYQESNNHKWEGNNELYVLFSFEGLIRIKYVPIPAEITSLEQTLELDEITAASASYYLAEHFFRADMNDTAADRCAAKFRELKIDSMVKPPLTPSEIRDVYGIGKGV